METKSTFWQRIGLQDWFLTNENNPKGRRENSLTPDEVYKYIIQKFTESVKHLSFANRIVFYHEYIVIISPEDYREFMNSKQGILGLIVHECVNKFYEILNDYRKKGKIVEPSSSKWVFRVVSNPEYAKGDKGFTGKLMPESHKKEENLRVTFIPRQTGIAQMFDISKDALKGFTHYSEGYYEIPYSESLEAEKIDEPAAPKAYARFETILPDKQFSGKKLEFLMLEEEVIITGNEDERNDNNICKIPSEWVNNPHLLVKFNKADGKFYVASFGERTLLNENEVPVSDVNTPKFTPLPINSKLVLNGIVGVNIFKAS
jgi:hypothetical protein